MPSKESIDTVVIGGGQAGLAAGFYLSRAGLDFTVLEAGSRIGESWRKRWDSLRLFTPARYSSLPGLPFPADAFYFPTKDEVADYLQTYAATFQLPVRLDTKVESLERRRGYYLINTGRAYLRAARVIVATGTYQQPRIPAWAGQLDGRIAQLHSSAYRNPAQLPPGDVLVVGAGNSGAEIAVELSATGRRVWLSGRDVGHVPAESFGRLFNGRLYWWVISSVLSERTRIGRRMKRSTLHQGAPLIHIRPEEIRAAGVKRCPRACGAMEGRPYLADGQALDVAAVIWATGFRPDYRWIRLPVFGERGYPLHERGVVPQSPGLYFLGLLFQYSVSSSLIGGVGADARFIAGLIQSSSPRRRLEVQPGMAW